MNELIPVRKSNVRGNEIPTVSARELYKFLEVGKDFTTWIKDRIQQYGFEDGKDYCLSLPEKGEAQPCGFAANKTEYHLTLDMAKELSMVERNEKGRQARKYFIECEKKLKQITLPDFTDPAIAARAWADECEKKQVAYKKIKELTPKAEAFDHFIDGVNCKSVARVGKELGIGEINFFQFLRDISYLQSSEEDWNLPYQRYLSAGYFAVRSVPIKKGKKFVNVSQTLITPRGEAHLAELWRNKPAPLPKEAPDQDHPLSVFLRTRREELGLKVRGVETRTKKKVSQSYFSQLEWNFRGLASKVGFDRLRALGKVLKVDPMYLYRLSRGQEKVQNG